LATFLKKLDAIAEGCSKVSLRQVMDGLRTSRQACSFDREQNPLTKEQGLKVALPTV